MTKETRGFASMTPEKQRKIASMGGKAAHAKGTAHVWNKAQARLAGKKGGEARARRIEADAKTKQTIEIPVNLARLLVSEPEDLKSPEQFEDIQKTSKALLKVLMEASK